MKCSPSIGMESIGILLITSRRNHKKYYSKQRHNKPIRTMQLNWKLIINATTGTPGLGNRVRYTTYHGTIVCSSMINSAFICRARCGVRGLRQLGRKEIKTRSAPWGEFIFGTHMDMNWVGQQKQISFAIFSGVVPQGQFKKQITRNTH